MPGGYLASISGRFEPLGRSIRIKPRMGSRAHVPGKGGSAARPARLALATASLALAFIGLAAPASATFHEISIREVFPGGASNNSFVVLQAYSSGQNLVSGHAVTAYDASGGQVGTASFSGNVSNGANQMTVLVADTAFSGPTPDLTMAALNLDPAGGAVCWAGVDCASWGAFSGVTTPSAAPPASPGGVAATKSIRRKISSNCATLLELPDDTNSSAADFEEADPNPRNNASTITEMTCAPPPPAPNTSITSAVPAQNERTQSTEATFTFAATPSAGASFECKIDAEPSFAACTSPKTYSGLTENASHTFQVRAVHPVNGTDASPATRTWTVDTVAPTATITQHPADPSPGNSVAFKFTSSEPTGAKFECRLSPPEASFSACNTQPKTYSSLADGDHTFEVRAVDAAGNVQPTPTSFEWEVDNSLADTTPPETRVLSGPPDPTEGTTAAFTYESTEAGSTFRCRLDAEAFASCPTAGKTYEGLLAGPHTFEVFAIDASGNEDKSPAGRSFTVVSVLPPPEMKPPEESPPPAVAPDTRITSKPPAKTRDRTPTIKFKATVSGATYQCRVDKAGFKPCRSPFTTKSLTLGRHKVMVRAVAGGIADASPAVVGFKVVKARKKR
jgi:hypothetical protein